MADLDDFFAKKGKKKKKKPTVQKLEDVEPSTSNPDEEPSQPIVQLSASEDSEWLESKTSTVEINPEDIQGVTLLKDEETNDTTSSEDKTENDGSGDTNNGSQEEETKIVTRNPVASPWQPVTTTPSTVTQEQTIKSDITTVTSLAKDGKYVPPSLRRDTRKPHPSSGPPDISSTKAFPSLMVATKGEESKPSPPPVMKDYTELPLHNKFSALATD